MLNADQANDQFPITTEQAKIGIQSIDTDKNGFSFPYSGFGLSLQTELTPFFRTLFMFFSIYLSLNDRSSFAFARGVYSQCNHECVCASMLDDILLRSFYHVESNSLNCTLEYVNYISVAIRNNIRHK